MDSFLQYLIIGLIGLLFVEKFATRYLPAILAKWNIKVGTEEREDKHQRQIDALEGHAQVANHEMGQVVEELGALKVSVANIEKDVAFIRGQLSN